MTEQDELIYAGSRKVLVISEGFGVRFPKVITDNIKLSREDIAEFYLDKKNRKVIIKFSSGDKNE